MNIKCLKEEEKKAIENLAYYIECKCTEREDFELDGFEEETLEIQQKINSKMPNSKRIEKLLYRVL